MLSEKSIFRQAVRLPRKLQDALFFTPKAQVDKRHILQVLNVRFAAPLKFFLLAIRGYCFVKENPKITTNRTFKILRSLMGIDFYCSKAKTARNTCVFRGFLTKLRWKYPPLNLVYLSLINLLYSERVKKGQIYANSSDTRCVGRI